MLLSVVYNISRLFTLTAVTTRCAFDRFQTLDLAGDFFKRDNIHYPPRANINDKDLLAAINASHKPGESMLQAPAQRNASGRKI